LFLATNDVIVNGADTRIGNNVNDGATGTNADIFRAIAAIDPNANTNDAIDVLFGSIIIGATGTVEVSDGARVTTSTIGSGSTGVVFVGADRVTVTGTGVDNEGDLLSSGLFSSILPRGQGQAGGVLVQAATRFTLSDSALLISNTFGTGDAGRVFVQAGTSIALSNGAEIRSATEANGRAGIVLLQAPTIGLSNSLVSSSTFPGAQGNAGGVFVEAGTLTLDRSSINSSTFGRRNAGVISIQTDSDLILTNRSNIITASRVPESEVGATGDAGAIFVQTDGDLILNNSRIDSNVELGATGNAGGIFVGVGGSLYAINQSLINTSAATTEAGNIVATIRGPVFLRNGSNIIAITLRGDGGNLFLSGTNFLVLEQGSNVTAQAGLAASSGTPRVEGDGGNIELDIGALILGTPPNDSNIAADANGGDGGNITIVRPITLQDIAERPPQPQTNDISASSEFGNDGFITLNQLDVDPVRGLVELPTSLVDISGLAIQGCPQLGGATAGQLGELYITGRGGIPPSADEPRSSETVMAEWVESPDAPTEETEESAAGTLTPEPVPEAIEFTHWQVDDNGDVLLLAHNSTPAPPVTPVCP
jgi:large exoprotein involved in heme utilization and adhesion